MKIAGLHFHQGPNVWAKGSGLRIACSWEPWPQDDGADLDAAQAFVALLADAIPIAPESAFLASPDFVQGGKACEVRFVLALSEILARDFCVRPEIGSILDLGDGRASCFIPCDDAPIGLACLELAVEIAGAAPGFRIADPAQFREYFGQRYRAFRQQVVRHKLDQSTLGMVRAAARRGIPSSRLVASGRFVQLGQGIHGRRVIETVTDGLGVIGSRICADKLIANTLLERSGLPTPRTHPAETVEEALNVAKKLGFPLVTKPRAGGKGIGVTVNIRSEEKLRAAFQIASKHRKGAVIEKFVDGHDHRLLVVGGQLVAAARRVPAHVAGDGVSTVRQLVELANRDPRRGVVPFERLLERIAIDDEALDCLQRAGLGPESVPAAGVTVVLRGTANISRGGTAVDVTAGIHPDNRQAVERAARLIGGDVLGIDFLSPDIGRSWREVPSAILEANTSPGLRPHLVANPDHDVFAAIIDHLFPDGSDGRVPTVGVTGSIGKTSTTAMIAAILSHAGLVVARSTTQGAWIGSEQVRAGDLSYGGVGQMLLQDPTVEAGVCELARGALLKSGLVLDALDVGVELGVLDNHVGFNGVESRADLARVKRLVVENARKLAVLNADDPLTLAMRDHAGAEETALVSAGPDNLEVLAHRDRGGLAAFLDEQDGLVLFEGGKPWARIAIGELPATREGTYRPAAIHALFAACACRGLGIESSVIVDALKAFRSDLETNPARNNWFAGLPYTLAISQFDGSIAAGALAAEAAAAPLTGRKRLLTNAAGNRTDAFIRDTGRSLAGAFDDYYLTDWYDRRGRPPTETPRLLAAGLLDEGVDPARIHIFDTPAQAIPAAYGDLGPDDLLLDGLPHALETDEWFRLRGLRREGTGLRPI